MEVRVNNASSSDEGAVNTVEVCINDQWHDSITQIITNNSPSPQNISVQETFTSMIIIWSPVEQSIPNHYDKNISGYSVLCTTSSLSDHGQIHEVRVSNISTSTTRVQISGLLPGTAYQCCVNAHIQTNTPLDLISSTCVTVSTASVQEPNNDGLIIGSGSGLGFSSLLLLVSVVSMLVALVVSKTCSTSFKCNSTISGDTKRYDKYYY